MTSIADVHHMLDLREAQCASRETTLAKREAVCHTAEICLAVAEAKFSAVDNINQRLLANRQIRESYLGNVQRQDTYGGGGAGGASAPSTSWQSKPENHERTVEER